MNNEWDSSWEDPAISTNKNDIRLDDGMGATPTSAKKQLKSKELKESSSEESRSHRRTTKCTETSRLTEDYMNFTKNTLMELTHLFRVSKNDIKRYKNGFQKRT